MTQEKTRLSCMVNNMDVGDLATEGARASTATVLTHLTWNIPVLVPDGLIRYFL